MKRKIEVVISDGNTIVNEIHMENETIADVLKQHGFNWMHGTLKVNGVAIQEESEKDFINCPISDFAPSFKRNEKIKIDCQTPANDPSKLTAKQIAQLRKKQKAAESEDKSVILFYEIGYDNSNIIGSGTDYIVEYKTKYAHDAFYYFSQPGMTFLRRTIRDGLHLRHEYYNSLHNVWE